MPEGCVVDVSSQQARIKAHSEASNCGFQLKNSCRRPIQIVRRLTHICGKRTTTATAQPLELGMTLVLDNLFPSLETGFSAGLNEVFPHESESTSFAQGSEGLGGSFNFSHMMDSAFAGGFSSATFESLAIPTFEQGASRLSEFDPFHIGAESAFTELGVGAGDSSGLSASLSHVSLGRSLLTQINADAPSLLANHSGTLTAESPLANLAKDNQIVVIADLEHEDHPTHFYMVDQLQAAKAVGVKHFYIELSKNNYKSMLGDLPSRISTMTSSELLDYKKSPDNPYSGSWLSELAIDAKRLDIDIHPIDDSTQFDLINAKYPEQAKLARNTLGMKDDERIRISSAPEKMRSYLSEIKSAVTIHTFRNEQMIENVSLDMKDHPNKKALLLIGADHASTKSDIDEGLAAAGFKTATVSITGPKSKMIWNIADLPDAVINSEKNSFLNYTFSGALK